MLEDVAPDMGEVICTQTISLFYIKNNNIKKAQRPDERQKGGKKQKEKIHFLCIMAWFIYFHGPHCENISASPKDRKIYLNMYVLLQKITVSKKGGDSCSTPGTSRNNPLYGVELH